MYNKYHMTPKTKKTAVPKIKFTKKEKKIAAVAFKADMHLNFREAFETEDEGNFEYTLLLNGVQVSLLDINGTTVSDIRQSGKVNADIGKPFFIEVQAVLNSPTGSGSLQLKFLPANKDVFDKPQQFTFEPSGRGGLFLEDVKLPS